MHANGVVRLRDSVYNLLKSVPSDYLSNLLDLTALLQTAQVGSNFSFLEQLKGTVWRRLLNRDFLSTEFNAD